MAVNPSMPQPWFDPDVMSLRPARPPPYSQGLRKPSGFSPLESMKSFNSEIIPATTCALAISWVFEDGPRREEG